MPPTSPCSSATRSLRASADPHATTPGPAHAATRQRTRGTAGGRQHRPRGHPEALHLCRISRPATGPTRLALFLRHRRETRRRRAMLRPSVGRRLAPRTVRQPAGVTLPAGPTPTYLQEPQDAAAIGICCRHNTNFSTEPPTIRVPPHRVKGACWRCSRRRTRCWPRRQPHVARSADIHDPADRPAR